MWELEYFEKDNGRCPVQEFLDKLNPKTELPYIINALEQLEEHGNQLRRPQVDFLQDGIYELRVKRLRVNYRLLYFFIYKNTIVITHGIKKKDDIVDPSEIKKAKEYRQIYITRQSEKK